MISSAWPERFINKDWEQPGWGKRNRLPGNFQSNPSTEDDNTADPATNTPGWVPNDSASGSTTCTRDIKYEVLEFYYTKLANYLLNSRNLKTDDNENYIRFIEVKMTKAQLEKYQSIVGNPAAMDAIIFDVISSSNDAFILSTVAVFEQFCEKVKHYFGNVFVSSDLKFFTYISTSLLAVWFISKKFNKHFLIVAISAAFFVNYFVDYRRCGLVSLFLIYVITKKQHILSF